MNELSIYNYMKRNLFVIVISISILSGCFGFFPPKWDNNEYLLVTEYETHSRMLFDECKSPDLVRSRLQKMSFNINQLNTYSFYLPDNSEVYEISTLLSKMTSKMKVRYEHNPPSVKYCQLKAKTMIAGSRRTLQAIGKIQGVNIE